MSILETNVQVAWSDDELRFRQALIPAISQTPAFRRIPLAAFWQPFDAPVHQFHQRFSRLVPLGINGPVPVHVLVTTAADPQVFLSVTIDSDRENRVPSAAPQANPIAVQIDPNDSSRLIFNQPLTLDQAVRYLFDGPMPALVTLDGSGRPTVPFRPDPAESSANGPHRRFLIDTNQTDLLAALGHGLATFYATHPAVIANTAAVVRPPWVPDSIWQRALNRQLPEGITEFPGPAPWGKGYAWRHGDRFNDVQFFLEFPNDLDFYLDIAGNRHSIATLLRDTYASFNLDMRYYLNERHVSPRHAREEIQRINDQALILVLQVSILSLTSLSVARRMIAMRATELIQQIRSRRQIPTSRPNRGLSFGTNRNTPFNLDVLRREAIRYWSRDSRNWPVKVIPLGHPSLSSTPLKVRGYITSAKFVTGRSLQELENILGLPGAHPTRNLPLTGPSYLSRGAALVRLKNLPVASQFLPRSYSNLPGGIPRPPTLLPEVPHSVGGFPVGDGAPQWELVEEVEAVVIAVVGPGGRF